MSPEASPSPLVALICSQIGQQHAVNRGFKSLAHLLFPFTTHDCRVKEPIDNSAVSHRVRLDIRDISNDGHLLSLSVLPYVLIQALKSHSDVGESIKTFRQVLGRWAEPSDHESFGAYLACIFVVSTQDDNPLGEMSKMIQTQQTLYNSTSTLMIPPYCCPPKWATAHAKTPKHYVLLHDSTLPRSSTERRDEVFAQMCATYGTDNCQILQFDSRSESPEMSGLWSEIDELKDVLGRGLDDAYHDVSNSNTTTPGTTGGTGGASLLQSPSSPSSVSTISSILPTVSSVSPNTHKSNSATIWKTSTKILSVEDGRNAQGVIGKFLTACLTPHIEREMRSLYEAVGQKKGIGKSISTGMRKWFGTGSSSGNLAVPASYSWDSPEMQTRRLADLLLMFGSHGSAYDQYLPLKRDLEADKAMVAHAVALEMCVVALHSAQPNLNAKQFPIRYLDSPVANLLDHAKRYPSILRCAFNISDIYADLGCHKEAAATLARLSSMDGDHLVAVAQVLAAEQFEKAGMLRKASFHRVLAANRFSHAGIHGLAFDCYRLALPPFDQRHWGVLDEHLAVRLLQEGEKAGVMTPKIAAECVRRLISVCPKLSPTLQEERLRKIVHVLDAYSSHKSEPVLLLQDIPRVEMDSIKVIYGERPAWNEIDENEHQSVPTHGWITVERAAHYALFGASAPYRGMQLVSDEHSDNQKIRETPAEERFRVMLDLTNPLKIPIDLENVRLSVTDFQAVHPEVGTLQNLHLDAEETKTVELYVFPRIGCLKFRVDGLLYRLTAGGAAVEARIELECRGKRLNKTAKQQKSKIYTNDERLSATVAQKPWPLVEFRILKSPNKWSYCDQAQRYQLEIENIGQEEVVSMCLATNAFDRVAAGILGSEDDSKRSEIPLELAANDKKTAIFQFSQPFLKIGEKTRIFFDIRSLDEPTGSSVAPKTIPTVVLIAYRSANGSMRQWRRVVDGERRRLIQVEAEVLDLDTRTFSINLKNCVALSQAALSRVEVLRIRTARNPASLPSKSMENTEVKENNIKLLSTGRKIELESEQSDTFVAKIDEEGIASETWLSANKLATPLWPCPAVIPSLMDDETMIRVADKIGVLWKANIVNNEGAVTSFIGETFVDDPFARKLEEKRKANGDASTLQVTCSTSAKTLSHDFSTSRICEIPVTLHLKNTDSLRRAAQITVKYLPKTRDPVDSLLTVPPEYRQQMWVDRPVRKVRLEANDTKTVDFRWRTSQPSVYDLGGANLSVEAVFEGGDEADVKKFTVPSVLSVVTSTTATP